MKAICGRELPPEKVVLHQARCAACGGTPPYSSARNPYHVDYFSDEEAQAIIVAAQQYHWRMVFWVLYETGARISEVLKLRKQDILPTCELGLRTEKQKTRWGGGTPYDPIPISDDLYEELKVYAFRLRGEHLFPYDKTSAWKALRRVAAQVGISRPVRTHMFRHGLVRRIMAVPGFTAVQALTTAQKILRHKMLATTLRYAETTDREAKAAHRRMIEG